MPKLELDNLSLVKLENLAVEKLSSALNVLGIEPKFICPMSVIDTLDFDIGAYAELEQDPNLEIPYSFRFTQDVQTGNVYVSINDKCHNFGVVDIDGISADDVTSGFKSIIADNGLAFEKFVAENGLVFDKPKTAESQTKVESPATTGVAKQKFEIYSCEINETKVVSAQGIAEAMLDYLPWPTLNISIDWSPSKGEIEVIDKQTDFKYLVKLLSD